MRSRLGRDAKSCTRLNPLRAPIRYLKRILEILSLAHDLTVDELHDAHHTCRLPFMGNRLFRHQNQTIGKLVRYFLLRKCSNAIATHAASTVVYRAENSWHGAGYLLAYSI
ncbi:hypothetical protein CA603_43470 [Paraburkholderia hospita]|nr:hypothetical protein CA603_43470 [Paraburkholderia hospita]